MRVVSPDSAAQLVNGSKNDDLCKVILEATEGRGLHLPPYNPSAVASSLWTTQGTEIFDGWFLLWAAERIGCNMQERVTAVLDRFGHYDQETTPCPSQFQNLAKRLFDEGGWAMMEMVVFARTSRGMKS